MYFKKLAVRELLNVRQHLLIPHFLADVRVVQKSQMFLHMHMEKAACLPIEELKTCTVSESLRPPRGMCSRDTSTSEVTSRDLRTRASTLERWSVFTDATSLWMWVLIYPSSLPSAFSSVVCLTAADHSGLSGTLVPWFLQKMYLFCWGISSFFFIFSDILSIIFWVCP